MKSGELEMQKCEKWWWTAVSGTASAPKIGRGSHPQSDCCYWLQLGSRPQTGARPVLLLLTILGLSPAWVLGTVTWSCRGNPLQLDPYPCGFTTIVSESPEPFPKPFGEITTVGSELFLEPTWLMAWNSPTNQDGIHGYSNVGTTDGTTNVVAQQISGWTNPGEDSPQTVAKFWTQVVGERFSPWLLRIPKGQPSVLDSHGGFLFLNVSTISNILLRDFSSSTTYLMWEYT